MTAEEGDRKDLPLEHRLAARAELLEWMNELHAKGRPSSQMAVGQLIGRGYSQTIIGRLKNYSTIGEGLFEDLLKARKLTVEQLLKKHASAIRAAKEASDIPPDVREFFDSEAARELEATYRPQVDRRYPGAAMDAIYASQAHPVLQRIPLKIRWQALAKFAAKEPDDGLDGADLYRMLLLTLVGGNVETAKERDVPAPRKR